MYMVMGVSLCTEFVDIDDMDGFELFILELSVDEHNPNMRYIFMRTDTILRIEFVLMFQLFNVFVVWFLILEKFLCDCSTADCLYRC